jgi:NAD(P)-dependent dehydrogenase (short-subunit alcohol dehydrogenase family)
MLSYGRSNIVAANDGYKRHKAPLQEDRLIASQASETASYGHDREGRAGTTAMFDEQALLRRSARPDEIARAILFLGSADANYIMGQTLVVEGGYSIR